MAGAKITVIYPRPTDVETFERRYREGVHILTRQSIEVKGWRL
jgi:hypothetical protein